MNCEDLDCSLCCIPDENNNPICSYDLRLCRFETKPQFYKLYILAVVLVTLFYIIPLIYRLLEILMLRPIFKDKSLYEWYSIKFKQKATKEKTKIKNIIFPAQKIHPISMTSTKPARSSKRLTMLTSKVNFKTFSKYFNDISLLD